MLKPHPPANAIYSGITFSNVKQYKQVVSQLFKSNKGVEKTTPTTLVTSFSSMNV